MSLLYSRLLFCVLLPHSSECVKNLPSKLQSKYILIVIIDVIIIIIVNIIIMVY